MNIILDTNVFMVSLASRSKYYLIYQSLLTNVYNLYLSNEILTEYDEVISERLGCEITDLKLKELLNLKTFLKLSHFIIGN